MTSSPGFTRPQLVQLVDNLEGRAPSGVTAYANLLERYEKSEAKKDKLEHYVKQLRSALLEHGIPIPKSTGTAVNFVAPGATVNNVTNVFIHSNPWDHDLASQQEHAASFTQAAQPQQHAQLPDRTHPQPAANAAGFPPKIPNWRNNCTRGRCCRRQLCTFAHQDQRDAYGNATIDVLPRFKPVPKKV